jgi:Domain of unknown function (DUF4440)
MNEILRGKRSGALGLGAAVLAAGLAWWPASVMADVPIDPEVLAAREATWRAWFAGDEIALGTLLPPDFIGIAWSDTPLSNRAETVAASRAFHASGGRLVRLTFPETRAQRFGKVMVLYGRFEVVLETGGSQQIVRGRLTETFVRRAGKWLHPGWHLDVVPAVPTAEPSPAKSQESGVNRRSADEHARRTW